MTIRFFTYKNELLAIWENVSHIPRKEESIYLKSLGYKDIEDKVAVVEIITWVDKNNINIIVRICE